MLLLLSISFLSNCPIIRIGIQSSILSQINILLRCAPVRIDPMEACWENALIWTPVPWRSAVLVLPNLTSRSLTAVTKSTVPLEDPDLRMANSMLQDLMISEDMYGGCPPLLNLWIRDRFPQTIGINRRTLVRKSQGSIIDPLMWNDCSWIY